MKPARTPTPGGAGAGVDRLLQALTRHGTLKGEGYFTVSLAQARAKTTLYESTALARYLLFFVSSGIGSGARSIHIREQGPSYEIEMEGGGRTFCEPVSRECAPT